MKLVKIRRLLTSCDRADTDDDMVLECAANGGARHLVTFNVADFKGPAERFGIKPLTPGQMLKEARS
jgi:predicted nucleic acid-binding protein